MPALQGQSALCLILNSFQAKCYIPTIYNMLILTSWETARRWCCHILIARCTNYIWWATDNWSLVFAAGRATVSTSMTGGMVHILMSMMIVTQSRLTLCGHTQHAFWLCFSKQSLLLWLWCSIWIAWTAKQKYSLYHHILLNAMTNNFMIQQGEGKSLFCPLDWKIIGKRVAHNIYGFELSLSINASECIWSSFMVSFESCCRSHKSHFAGCYCTNILIPYSPCLSTITQNWLC